MARPGFENYLKTPVTAQKKVILFLVFFHISFTVLGQI